MGRRRTAVWNLVFGYAQLGVTITRNVLLVPLYLRFVDVSEYGAWVATAGVLAQLFVSDFGLTATVIQRAASAFGRGDKAVLSRAVGSSLSVSLLLGMLLTVLSLSVSPFIPAMAGGDAHARETLLYCFIIVAAGNGVGIVGLAATGLLRALQRPIVSGAITMASDVMNIFASVAMLYAGHGLYALAAGHAARNALLALAGVASCLWVCRRRLELRPDWSVRDARTMFAASYYQFFTSVAQRVQSKADVFFVGLLLGPQAAALYSLTARAGDTVQMLSAQVVASIDASLAHLHGGGDTRRFGEVLRIALASTACVGALGMLGVAAFNESFVALWVGPALFAGQPTSLTLAAAGLVTTLGSVFYVALTAQGEFRSLSNAYLSSIVLYVPALFMLVPFGLWGAAVATLLAALWRTGMLGNSLRRSLGAGPGAFWQGASLVAAITVPAVAIATFTLVATHPASGWGTFAGAVSVFLLVTGGVTWLANRRLFGQLARELNLSIGVLRVR